MDYYKLSLKKSNRVLFRDEKGTIRSPSILEIHINDVDEFVRWRDMPKPFEIGQDVKIVTGYHTGRTAKIYGINGKVLWVKVNEVNKMVEIHLDTVSHL